MKLIFSFAWGNNSSCIATETLHSFHFYISPSFLQLLYILQFSFLPSPYLPSTVPNTLLVYLSVMAREVRQNDEGKRGAASALFPHRG